MNSPRARSGIRSDNRLVSHFESNSNIDFFGRNSVTSRLSYDVSPSRKSPGVLVSRTLESLDAFSASEVWAIDPS